MYIFVKLIQGKHNKHNNIFAADTKPNIIAAS